MRTVRVSDEVKEIVDRHVASGSAPSGVAFVEEAIRLYAERLEDDEDELIAAAAEGMAAIERGDYVTISSAEDVEALRERVWNRAMILAEEMRANRPRSSTPRRTEAKAGE
ncbi:MAG TPA: hypothetical protein VGG99_04800 [Acetobacteraceae bacterium]|jgi:predicted transcriptional regulator